MKGNKPTRRRKVGYAVASAVLACVIWVIVVNAEDPVTTKRITNIPITFENTEVFTNNGLSYEIEDDITTATVKVSARRSNLSSISADDFVATVDFNLINDLNGAVPVNVTYTGDADLIDDYEVITSTVRVTTESVSTRSMDVNITTTGTLEEGLSVGEITADPKTVYINGPVSMLNSIYSVGAVVDINGATDNIETTVDLEFYDARGQVINPADYGADVTISDGSDDITSCDVTVEILSTVGATLNFNVSGTDAVADGYRYTGVNSNVTSVVLKGGRDVIENITSIDITDDSLDVTGANADVVAQIDLEKYLPEGVTIEGSTEITVTMSVEPLVTASYDIASEHITLNGADTTRYGYGMASATVKLTGTADELAGINASDLRATVDVSGLEAGRYDLSVTVSGLPDGVEQAEECTIRVTVMEAS